MTGQRLSSPPWTIDRRTRVDDSLDLPAPMRPRRSSDATRAPGAGWRRPWVFLLIVVAVGLLAARLMKPAFVPGLPEASPGIIDVAIDMKGFDRESIRVRAGEPVTIRLTSLDGPFHLDGGGKHQFAIDELGVDIIAPARGSASATFTPAEAGTYVFYCDVCCGGRANPSMRGQLVVGS